MRTGAAAGHIGFFHEAAFYDSDDELLSLVVPFVEGGRAAGEPTLVTLADRNAALVRGALSGTAGVEFIAGGRQYDRPAACIRSYRDRFADLVARGAGPLRVVGDVPHPGLGVPWDGWGRYEAVINHAFDHFPVWGLCPYDRRTAPAHVLHEVERLHPHVAAADGSHLPNPRYEDPAGYLARREAPAEVDALEASEPAVALADPAPREARRAAEALLAASRVGGDDADGFVLSVSEVATNAIVHGRPPVLLRGWAASDRVVVTVHDRGPGPADPFAGLVPRGGPGAERGRGLWLAGLLCSHLGLSRGRNGDGFTVRLVAGAPRLAG